MGPAVIVADTNIIFYLLVRGERSREAELVFKKDPEWSAPILWRFGLRNVLVSYLARRLLQMDEALRHMENAEQMLRGHEVENPSADVVKLAFESGCSAYDCEFVVAARSLGVKLITADGELLSTFPDTALSMREFCS